MHSAAMKYHLEWPDELQTVERKFLREIETLEKEYNFKPNTIVILEGVFLLREELSQYMDYKVFLEIPFEESKRRAEARDPQATMEKYETKYLPAQRKYLSLYPPELHADIIIDNINWEYPSIINIC